MFWSTPRVPRVVYTCVFTTLMPQMLCTNFSKYKYSNNKVKYSQIQICAALPIVNHRTVNCLVREGVKKHTNRICQYSRDGQIPEWASSNKASLQPIHTHLCYNVSTNYREGIDGAGDNIKGCLMLSAVYDYNIQTKIQVEIDDHWGFLCFTITLC